MPEPKSLSLAVLIDADNAHPRYAEAIFDEIGGLGEANVRRIYGDFSTDRLKGWDAPIQAMAILQQQQRNNTTGKNAADIALVIDAMDLMHKGTLDGFCLVSSDSDFTRLAQRLREDGMIVYGFGERKTPEAFRSACNRFIYVENLLEMAAPESGMAEGAAALGSGPGEGAAVGTAATAEPRKAPSEKGSKIQPKKEPASKAVPIIRKAMAGLESDEGWAALANVGERISNIASDFDPRSYGHTKLSTLVEKSGGFDIQKHGGTLLIRARNPKKKAPATPV